MMSGFSDTEPGQGESRLRRLLRNCISGAVTWNLVWLASVLIMGGVAIDAASAYRMKSAMQSAANLAALEAVRVLPDETAARSGMRPLLGQIASGPYTLVEAREQNVVFGHWDDNLGFRPDGPDKNAARVTLRRTARAETLLAANLLRLIGLDMREIEVTATAVRRTLVVENCRQWGDDAASGGACPAAPAGQSMQLASGTYTL